KTQVKHWRTRPPACDHPFKLEATFCVRGVEARLLASRSGVQRQPKRAPIRCRLRGGIAKYLRKRRGGPTQRSTNNASYKKPKSLRRREVALAPFSAAKVCTRLCCRTGGETVPMEA